MTRGKIRGDAEGEVVRDFVSNVDNEDIIGPEAYHRLAVILENWEVGGLS
ncbi:MAG: hypothetical protein ACREIA_24485 [Opitutaceae bacterium]